MAYDEDMWEATTNKRSTAKKRAKKKRSHGLNEGYAEKIRKKQEKIDTERMAKGLASKWEDK